MDAVLELIDAGANIEATDKVRRMHANDVWRGWVLGERKME